MRMRIHQGKSQNLEQAVTLALEVEGFRKIEAGRRENLTRRLVREIDVRPTEADLKIKELEEKMNGLLREKTDADYRRSGNYRKNLSDVECFRCKQRGHYKRDCPMGLRQSFEGHRKVGDSSNNGYSGN